MGWRRFMPAWSGMSMVEPKSDHDRLYSSRTDLVKDEPAIANEETVRRIIPGFSSAPDWFAVKAHIEAKLVIHRAKLELIGTPIVETEASRYAIAELKALLNLAKPSKMQAVASDDSG